MQQCWAREREATLGTEGPLAGLGMSSGSPALASLEPEDLGPGNTV